MVGKTIFLNTHNHPRLLWFDRRCSDKFSRSASERSNSTPVRILPTPSQPSRNCLKRIAFVGSSYKRVTQLLVPSIQWVKGRHRIWIVANGH
ncbi:hypothetical protein D777_02588 [Marinobacter nitratireducens]|uniref:Uncharacterized protein n=1 Tax=Marinobacter nitratireducens TaxID=1137280 RepID=A0A072MZJ7_9GAMM|nr:hypothetical protein D777_02588 [Marinobacter nitratireducens]